MLEVLLSEIHVLISALSPYLAKGSIKEKDFPKITNLLDRFVQIMPLPEYPLIPAQLIRMTQNDSIPGVGNNRIIKLDHLKYPPSESVVRYNRCTVPGFPVLYGAFELITATKESPPAIEKLVTHTEWRLKEGMQLKSFPIFFIAQQPDKTYNPISLDIKILHENNISGLSENEKKIHDMSMEFLAKCFAKEVDPNNHLDYLLSAYISYKIFQIQDANYEVILYPSVQAKLGSSNMAVKPEYFDAKFIPFEVKNDILYSYRITPTGILYDNLSYSRNFDLEKGLIIWKD